MGKFIDYLALCVVTAILTFVWAALLVKNLWGALVLAVTISLILGITVYYIKRKSEKPCSADRLLMEFSLQDDGFVLDIFKKIENFNALEYGKNYFVLQNCVVIIKYKFSPLSPADMLGIIEICDAYKDKKAFLLSRGLDKNAQSILYIKGIKLNLIKIRTVYKFLKKHKALPNLSKIKTKFNFKSLLSTVFSRLNFKYYVFSGASLIFIAFVTPLKIYYLTIGSVLLVFAILTLTPIGNGSIFNVKFSNELENAIKQGRSPRE